MTEWASGMSEGFWHGVQVLFQAGVAYLAYSMAKGAASATKSLRVDAAKAAGWIVGLAAFAAWALGEPTCEGGDPLFGGCDEYGEATEIATPAKRAETFVFLIVFLGVPVAMAFGKEWRRRSS